MKNKSPGCVIFTLIIAFPDVNDLAKYSVACSKYIAAQILQH